MSIRPAQPHEVGLVYIKNTRDLQRILVSQSYVEQLKREAGVDVPAEGMDLAFDAKDVLKSPFTT